MNNTLEQTLLCRISPHLDPQLFLDAVQHKAEAYHIRATSAPVDELHYRVQLEGEAEHVKESTLSLYDQLGEWGGGLKVERGEILPERWMA